MFITPIRTYKDIGPAQSWGADRSYRGGWHQGLDFVAPIGTPVYAVGSGVVVTAKQDWTPKGAGSGEADAGRVVVIKHANGYTSRYLHLAEVLVTVGQRVYQGQIVAYSGNTGIYASSPHLHFDLKAGDAAYAQYLTTYGVHTPDASTSAPGTPMAYGKGVPAEALLVGVRYTAAAKTKGAARGVKYAGGFNLSEVIIAGGVVYLVLRLVYGK